MFDIIEKIGNFVINIGESILNAIVDALGTFLGMILYYVEAAECKILSLVYRFFEVFAGLQNVKYYQSNINNQVKLIEAPLINVFFQHSTITQVYWGMALIGVAMAFGFAIWAVIKKMGDLGGKEQRSMGQILGSLLKSILIILGMNIIITVTLTASNTLMQSITDLFNNPSSAAGNETIVFSDDEYYTMNQIFQTIGAYSLNPSYNSRYNINSCYNSIRQDLQYLYKTGTFNAYYVTKKTVVVNGVSQTVDVDTWQSVLQKIVRAHNLSGELSMDIYYEEVSNAILYAMDVLRTNASFQPLRSYKETYKLAGTTDVGIDVIIFLAATGDAAKNPVYNTNVSMTDPVRGPYFVGEKTIYDYSQVKEDFDMSIVGIDHVIILLMCVLIGKELVRVILACVVRIFQMLVLYIVAPPIIAVMPLDGGKKFQEWCTAFIIQAFGIFGTVITMRLLILFMPICISSELVLFDNPVLDLLAKVMLIYGGTVAANRSAAMITGILANNAGMQAIQAGDVRGEADKMMASTGIDKAFGAPLALAGKAAGLAADVTGVSTLAGKAKDLAGKVAGGLGSMRQSMREHGGLLGAGLHGAKTLATGGLGGAFGGGGGGGIPQSLQGMGGGGGGGAPGGGGGGGGGAPGIGAIARSAFLGGSPTQGGGQQGGAPGGGAPGGAPGGGAPGGGGGAPGGKPNGRGLPKITPQMKQAANQRRLPQIPTAESLKTSTPNKIPAKPPTPGGKPTTPGGKPTTPGGKPTTPGGKPTTPGGKPTTPGGKGNVPANNSNLGKDNAPKPENKTENKPENKLENKPENKSETSSVKAPEGNSNLGGVNEKANTNTNAENNKDNGGGNNIPKNNNDYRKFNDQGQELDPLGSGVVVKKMKIPNSNGGAPQGNTNVGGVNGQGGGTTTTTGDGAPQGNTNVGGVNDKDSSKK